MTREEMLAQVDRWLDAWNRHDADAVAACYADDGIWRGIGRALPGREAIRDGVQQYLDAFADLVAATTRVGCDGDIVYAEWNISGTHSGPFLGIAATNRLVEVDGCNVLRIAADGLIMTDVGYWDVASLLQQIGALPEAATGTIA